MHFLELPEITGIEHFIPQGHGNLLDLGVHGSHNHKLRIGVKTLRKHAKIESSRNFKLYHIYTTFLLENVDFLKLS